MSLEKKTVIGLTLAWLVLYMFGNNMLVITDPVSPTMRKRPGKCCCRVIIFHRGFTISIGMTSL